MIRFGLCCIFIAEDIRFRHLTAASLKRLSRDEQIRRISEICLHNSRSLLAALETVRRLDIGAFRILSQIFPLYTHPEVGYELDDLPDKSEIRNLFSKIRSFRGKNDIRLSFHPDQFVVLASPEDKVVLSSIAEIEYQAGVAKLCGAELINIHIGGTYGDKCAALARFAENFRRLSANSRKLVSIENDDRQYTPSDLLPLCEKLKVPMVYDVHHHRCNPDGMDIEDATRRTIRLWKSLGREPYFHISSPKYGWKSGNPAPHADYIEPADFPSCWLKADATVDVEAKAKELAVRRLRESIC